MAKYNGPVCRLCRREGQKLFLKGERCFTDKCAYERKESAPGMHGMKKGKVSEFGAQLREKQKVRRVYGVMEGPFKRTFEGALKERGITSEVFFQKLELRLDNVIYRMGFAASRQDAKQVVRHNHVLVNGRRCNIPSAELKVGDAVSLRSKSVSLSRFKEAEGVYDKRPKLGWFEVDRQKSSGKVLTLPSRADVGLAVKEHMIVELYSK